MTVPKRITQLDAALHYASKGFEVFPANPRTKAPITESGMKDATTDEATIRQWWTDHPNALIACRIPADQVVLDIDPRHGGDTTWNELESAYATILSARVHRSGRNDGGAHHWFKRPPGRLSARKLDQWAERNGVGHRVNETKWTAGIDILHHDHRYSILPPSPHPDTGLPYRWAHKDEPAEMPAFLADLITADPDPEPITSSTNTNPIQHSGDSIADWFTRHARWNDLLAPAGWTLISGDGDGDGSKWRHPNASAAWSGTIRHGMLFVYSPNTPFEQTDDGDPHGYTRFRAWATLHHRGDLSTAARAALELRDGPRPPDVDLSALIAKPATSAPTASAVNLPDEFWNARPSLQMIRQAAHSRTRSADAVLLATLARVAALIPPQVVLPSIAGSRASLNFLGGIVATSGGGKSTSNDVARDLVPIDRVDVVADVPPGSGEGLTELYFEMVPEEQPDGKMKRIKRQTKSGALIYLDEGQALAEMGNRKGATLMPTLRSAWSGAVIGQSNATQETHRVLKPHSYRMAIIIGFQLEYAAALIADTAGGTPQRFVFATATDPHVPDERPEWPGEIIIRPPEITSAGTEIGFHDDIWTEVRQRQLLTTKGEFTPDPLDSHADLVRMKVAALLAIIDGRFDVGLDDWELAQQVMTASNAVRSWAIEYNIGIERRAEEAYAMRLANREIVAAETAESRALVSGAKSMAKKAHKLGPCSLRDLQSAVSSRVRKLVSYDAMIDYAASQGWLERVGETFQPGESRPA